MVNLIQNNKSEAQELGFEEMEAIQGGYPQCFTFAGACILIVAGAGGPGSWAAFLGAVGTARDCAEFIDSL